MGASSGSRPSGQASVPCLDAPRFDPARIEEIANVIESACVPHESGLLGAGTRSLRYYATVGIDYFGHDYERVRRLFEEAARKVLVVLDGERSGG